MTGRRLIRWAVALTMASYILWFLILKYGTPEEKAAATAAVILSPIPPIP